MGVNIITNPEDFLSAPWVGTNHETTGVSNVAEAPDGTMTADRLQDDGLGGSGQTYFRHDFSGLTNSQLHHFSYFAKADQLNWTGAGTISFTSPATQVSRADIANGVLGVGASDHDESVIAYPDGWYRYVIGFTTDPVDTAGTLRIYVCEDDNDNNITRDGTSSILIWGAKFEEGPLTDYVSQNGTVISLDSGLLLPAVSLAKAMTRPLTNSLTRRD